MEDEGFVAVTEQRPRKLNDALHAVPGLAQVIAKIQRHEGSTAGGPCVVARIGEASDALEQDLQLKQDFVFAVCAEPREPCVSRKLLLTPQSARVAQQFGVGVGLSRLARPCVDSAEGAHLRALNTKGCR